jgi:bifunctional DNA-binding transcriptional regulator/antitoxin component of YhaV-PrlF toxin-antitoxin module
LPGSRSPSDRILKGKSRRGRPWQREVRQYLTNPVTTRVSSKGQIVLPAEICREDSIQAGQTFDIERLGPGEYRLMRKTVGHSKKGVARLLLNRPEKGWFRPMDSGETTDSICPSL